MIIGFKGFKDLQYFHSFINIKACFTIPTSLWKLTSGGLEESGLSGWGPSEYGRTEFSTDITSSVNRQPNTI